MGDFSALCSHSSIFTATDGFTEDSLICAQVPATFRAVKTGPVRIKAHACVGSHSVVLPGVTLWDGATVGAMSVVKKDVPEGHALAGEKLLRVRDVQSLRMRADDFLRGLGG